MPTLSSPMQAAAQAPVNLPFFLVYLDVAGDPLWAWTGRGDTSVTIASDPILAAGQTFIGAGDVANVSGIVHAADGSVQSMTMTLGNADFTDPAAYDFVNSEASWSRRLAVIWMGFVDTTTGVVVASPVRIVTGRMVHVGAVDGAQPSITVKVTSKSGADGQRASLWQLASEHQKVFYPGDESLAFVPQLVSKELRFGTADNIGRSAGGGAPASRNEYVRMQ